MATTEEAFAKLGQNIKRALDASGLSLEQVAEQALMEEAEIQQVIAGADLDVTFEALVILGGAIRAEPAALFDGVRWVPHDGEPGGEYVVAKD